MCSPGISTLGTPSAIEWEPADAMSMTDNVYRESDAAGQSHSVADILEGFPETGRTMLCTGWPDKMC